MRAALAIAAGFLAGALYALRRAGRGEPRPDDYQVPPTWRPQPD